MLANCADGKYNAFSKLAVNGIAAIQEENMTYDFDREVSRRNTDSLKWEIKENELPMWVADMDFMTAPEIIDAVREKAVHGVYGYSVVPVSWYAAYTDWWSRRHHLQMEREWLIFCSGVIPAISSIVRKLTTVGEKILIQTPVYNNFFNAIENNGRQVLENPLQYQQGQYEIDFDDLELKLSDPQTSMMILCNPHNPVGKLWDKETLAKIGVLCHRHHVIVVSDEIHCDLTDPGTEYVPFAAVSDLCRENSITCLAPTKAFNLAGLMTAAVMVPDALLRHRVRRGFHTDEIAEPNFFAAAAAEAAFSRGEAWLDELRAYIYENRKFAAKFLSEKLPQITAVPAQATYLMWLDCTKAAENSKELAAFIRQDTGLYVLAGSHYGKAGEGFLRVNIACPRRMVKDGMERLVKGISDYLGSRKT